jgi:hypothetical protein
MARLRHGSLAGKAADGIRTHDLLHRKREKEDAEKAPDSSSEAENGDG